MAENVVQSVRQVIQDLVAPDIRELKADVKALRAEMNSFRLEMDSLRNEMRAGFAAQQALLEGIALRSELSAVREIADLRERITHLEERRSQQ